MNYTLDNYNTLRNENIKLKHRIIWLSNSCLVPNTLKRLYIEKYLTTYKNNACEIEDYINYIYIYKYICSDTRVIPSYELKIQMNDDIIEHSNFLSLFNLAEPLTASYYR
jgi:hypothetical protein